MAVPVAVAVLVSLDAVFIELRAAMIAEAGAKVIFFAATRAMVSQFSAGHGQKKTFIAIDEFYITDDKGVIEGQGAEGLESIVLIVRFAEFYPDVSQAHRNPVSILRAGLSKKCYRRCASVSNLKLFSRFPRSECGAGWTLNS